MTDKEIEKVDIEDSACVAMICIHDNEKYVQLEDWEKDVHRLQAIIKQLKAEKEQIGKETAEKIYDFVKSHTALSGDIEELLQYISETFICRGNCDK